MSNRTRILAILILALAIAITACAGTPGQSQQVTASPVPINTAQVNILLTATTVPILAATAIIATQENSLSPETNPVGDIPDTQVFVSYTDLSSVYSLDVPEGWARTNNGSDVRFVDKFDGLSVSLTLAAPTPTMDSIRQNEIANLTNTGRAFQVGQITELDLPGGHAVKISATVNSEPDSVTGKQVRLEEDIYIFFHNGTEAIIQLWAPQGADNVDQWKRISESFQWK